MNMNIIIILLLIAALFLIDTSEQDEKNQAAFQMCIDSGGVPLQSWFNEEVLGDCIYKPTEK
jgi:hypothetical protein